MSLRDAVPDGLEDVEDYYVSELLPKRVELDMGYLANPTLASTFGLMLATTSYVLSRLLSKLTAHSRHRRRLLAGLKSTTLQ